MADAEDVLDAILQEILDFFRELDHWIPISSTVLSWFVDIPEGKEKELYALSEAYTQAAQLYADHLTQISPYLQDLAIWTGDGTAQIAHESMQRHVTHVGNMIDAFAGASEIVHGTAQGIETTKWADAVNLLFLAVTTVMAIVSAFFTFGASLGEVGGAMAITRTAISMAARELLEKISEGITRKVIVAALVRGAQFMAFTLLSEGVAWFMETIEGHHPRVDGWDLVHHLADSFAVGFLGGLITRGAHGPIAESVSMASGQLSLNALQIAWDDAIDTVGLHDWATEHNLYVADAQGNPPGLFDGVLQSALIGAAFGVVGDRGLLRDAVAELELDLGRTELGLTDALRPDAVAAELPSTAGAPDLAGWRDPAGSIGDPAFRGGDPAFRGGDPAFHETTPVSGDTAFHETTPVSGEHAGEMSSASDPVRAEAMPVDARTTGAVSAEPVSTVDRMGGTGTAERPAVSGGAVDRAGTGSTTTGTRDAVRATESEPTGTGTSGSPADFTTQVPGEGARGEPVTDTLPGAPGGETGSTATFEIERTGGTTEFPAGATDGPGAAGDHGGSAADGPGGEVGSPVDDAKPADAATTSAEATPADAATTPVQQTPVESRASTGETERPPSTGDRLAGGRLPGDRPGGERTTGTGERTAERTSGTGSGDRPSGDQGTPRRGDGRTGATEPEPEAVRSATGTDGTHADATARREPGATGHEPAEAAGSELGSGEHSGTDPRSASDADRVTRDGERAGAEPSGERSSFWKRHLWDRHIEAARAEIDARYLRLVLKELGPTSFEHPEPARLTPDMVEHALRAEPRTAVGQRLRAFIEEHFTRSAEVEGGPVRVALDEAAIGDTFRRLHQQFLPDPSRDGAPPDGADPATRTRPALAVEEARTTGEEAARDAPSGHEGASYETSTHEQRWVAAHLERGDTATAATAVGRGHALFVEVLDRHFETVDWSSGQTGTVRSMVQRALDTNRAEARQFGESADLRSYLLDQFSHDVRLEDGRRVRVPLDDAAIQERIEALHRESRQLVDDPLGTQGTDPTGTAATHGHQDGAPTEPAVDPATTRGPPGPEPFHAQPDGPVREHHEGPYDRGYFVPDESGGPGGTLYTQDGVHRSFFTQRFEKLPVAELGGVDSPAARQALHEAAGVLVDAVHDRAVTALDHWLTGVDERGQPITLDRTDLARIGNMVSAVLLPDGTIEAATSVSHVPTGSRGEMVVSEPPPGVPVVPGRVEGSAVGLHHWAIAEALAEIPAVDRSGYHGLCAEPIALSEVARRLEPDFQRDFLARARGVDPAALDRLPPEQRTLDSLNETDRQRYRDEFRGYLRDSLDGGRSAAEVSIGRRAGEARFPCATDDRLLDSFGMRADYVERLADRAYVDADAGVVALAPEGDPLRANARLLRSEHPDWLVVAVHGDHSGSGFTAAFGGEHLSHVEVNRLVDAIVADHPQLRGRGKVLLVTCEADRPFTTSATGDTSSFAREFALRHRGDVLAASEDVWVSDTGDVVAGERSPADRGETIADDDIFEPDAADVVDPWVHLDRNGRIADPVRFAEILGKKTDQPGGGQPGGNWWPAAEGATPPGRQQASAAGFETGPPGPPPTGTLHILGFDEGPGAGHTNLLERVSRALGGAGDEVVLRRPGVPSDELAPGARVLGAEPIPGVTGKISPLLRLDGLPSDADVLLGYDRTAGVVDRLHRYAYPDAKLVQIVDRIHLDSGGRPDQAYVHLLGRADLVVAVGPRVAQEVRVLLDGLGPERTPPVHELPPVFEEQPLTPREPDSGGYRVLLHDADPPSMEQAAAVVSELRGRGIEGVQLTITMDATPADLTYHMRRLSKIAGADVEVKSPPGDAAGVGAEVGQADLILVTKAQPLIDPAFLSAVEHGVPVLVDARTGAGAFLGDASRVPGELTGGTVLRGPGGAADVAVWADRIERALVDLPAERSRVLDLRDHLVDAYRPGEAAGRLDEAIHRLGDHVSRIDESTWRADLSPREVVLRHAGPEPAAEGRTAVMTTCTVYWSDKGGVPTANREMAEGFAAQGALGYARVSTVDSGRPGLTAATAPHGVLVHGVEPIWGVLDEKGQPDGRAIFILPEGLPSHVDVIVGHSRFSGGGARWLIDNVYPEARYVHVLHTSPEVLDALKGDPDGLRHAQTERVLMNGADLVTGVGPLLGEEAARLAAEGSTGTPPSTHTLIPDMPFNGEAPQPRPGGGTFEILVQGRAGDPIKGIEFAAKLVAQLHDQGHDVALTVRGAPRGEGAAQTRHLLEITGNRPDLRIEVREYSQNPADLLEDLHRADLVLMPSVHEGFGLVATEAARAGRPVLVGEGTGAGRFFADPRYVPERLGEPAVVADGNTLNRLHERLAAITGPDGRIDQSARRALLEEIDQRRLTPWLERVRQAMQAPDPDRVLELRKYLADRYPPGSAARALLDALREATSGSFTTGMASGPTATPPRGSVAAILRGRSVDAPSQPVGDTDPTTDRESTTG